MRSQRSCRSGFDHARIRRSHEEVVVGHACGDYLGAWRRQAQLGEQRALLAFTDRNSTRPEVCVYSRRERLARVLQKRQVSVSRGNDDERGLLSELPQGRDLLRFGSDVCVKAQIP